MTDTASAYTLASPFTEILEDPKSQWTVDQVSQGEVVNRFHRNETKKNGIDYRIHTYWLRFTIRNNLDHAVTLYFNNQFGEPSFSFEYIYLYAKKDNDQWIEEKTGALVPWSQRFEAKFLQTLPLLFKPHQQQTIYIRLRDSFRNISAKNIDVHFQTALALYKEAYTQWVEGSEFTNNFLRALLLGVFVATVLFTFYNYLLIRERAYLYYLIFLFFYLLGRLPSFSFLLVPEYPVVFSWWGRHIIWILVHAFLVLFVRQFLNTRTVARFWDKLLLMTAAFQAVYLAFLWLTAPLFSFTTHLALQEGVLVTYEIVIGTIALTLIYLYRKRDSRSKFLLFTLAPFLLVFTLVEFIFFVLKNLRALLLENIISTGGMTSKFLVFSEYFSVLWMVVFFSGALTRRYTQARKALAEEALENERLQKEKEIEKSQLIARQKVELEKQVEQRTLELKHSLENLQATQKQLIQSEKMASLGELTAGIAHEIQNPLNFVNNFSEVNAELIEELKTEKSKVRSERNEELENGILNDISQNLEKIAVHGRRADAIVKGMLQHSSGTTGKKELTDINQLADEYLRLSFHGFRAKDQSFNPIIETHFAESIGKIEVIPQDIGRVLLNLFNNAFYAVSEKKKQLDGSFEPLVSVSTERSGDKIQVRVRDNGVGIPQKAVDKIFQPFFTTKPTGQGTGLGLSLSYDIIKAHGGELKVESKEGLGAEFIVVINSCHA